MADSNVTTTTDVRDAEPQPTSDKSVKLTSPTGTRVTASPDAAEKLKAQGWKSSK